jgi:hypothetical protein
VSTNEVMDPLAVTASTTGTTTDGSTGAATSEKPAATSFADLFAAAEKDLGKGEKLERVTGHEFARIKGGTRDSMCVNLSGNARSGQAFDLVTRGGHTFHAYGTGKDRVIVEVGGHAAVATPNAATTGGTQAKS